MAVVAFKLQTTERLVQYGVVEQITWFGRFIKEATIVGYGQYGISLPATAFALVRGYPDWMALGVAGLLGLIILVYLQKIGGKWETSGSTAWLKVIACGLAVFALGYGIFLTNRNVSIGVTTGIGNRIAIAAAIGVALSLVGAFGWISDPLLSG